MPSKQPTTPRDDQFLREFRCYKCRARLADEYIYAGRLVITCWRSKCKARNEIVLEPKK